jgi:hypothetical protein
MHQKIWIAGSAAILAVALTALPSPAAFHLWQIKEVFSNADGSVQFIEMFNSFNNENAVNGQTLRTNSDGVIKNFTVVGNLTSAATANRHMLFATPGFNTLPGGVTPDRTLPNPGVSGPFFNPNATSITITFVGSGDSMTFSGATLPKNGYQSLTDTAAVGVPPGTPNITVTTNSPTNFANVTGSVNLITPNGDYNKNGKVDAADYVYWRKSLGQAVSPAGLGADGNKNGTVDAGDRDFWSARFGNLIAGSGGGGGATPIPEPATLVSLFMGLLVAGGAGISRRS